MSKSTQSKQSAGLKRSGAPPILGAFTTDNTPQTSRASGMENSLRSLNDAPPQHSITGSVVESLGKGDGVNSWRNTKRSTLDHAREGSQVLEQPIDIAIFNASDVRADHNEKSKGASSHHKFPSAFPPPPPSEPAKIAPVRSKYGSRSLHESSATTTPGTGGLPYVSPSQIDAEWHASVSANSTPGEPPKNAKESVLSNRGSKEGYSSCMLHSPFQRASKVTDKESAMAFQPYLRVDMSPLVTAPVTAPSTSGKTHRQRPNGGGGYLRLSQHIGDVQKKSGSHDVASKSTSAHTKEPEVGMSSANNSTNTAEPSPTVTGDTIPYRASHSTKVPAVAEQTPPDETVTEKATSSVRTKGLGSIGESRLSSRIAAHRPLGLTGFESANPRNSDINRSFHSSFASTAPPSEGGNSPRSTTPTADQQDQSAEHIGSHVRAMLSSEFPNPAHLINFLDLPEERQVSELTNALMRQYVMRNVVPALQNSSENPVRDADSAAEKSILSSTSTTSYAKGGNAVYKERVKALCKKLFPCVSGSLKDHSAVCFLLDLAAACEADSAQNALTAFTEGTTSATAENPTDGSGADAADAGMIEKLTNEKRITVLEAVSFSETARNVELLRQESCGEEHVEAKPSLSPRRSDASRLHKRLSDAMKGTSADAMLAVEEGVYRFLCQRDFSVEACAPEVVQGLVKQHVTSLSSRYQTCLDQFQLQEVWRQAADTQSTLPSTTSSRAPLTSRGNVASGDEILGEFNSPRRDAHTSDQQQVSDAPPLRGSHSISVSDSPEENHDSSHLKDANKQRPHLKNSSPYVVMDVAALQETRMRYEQPFHTDESVLSMKDVYKMLEASQNTAATLSEAYPSTRYPVAPDDTLAYIFGVEGAYFAQRRDADQLRQLTNSMRSQAKAMSVSRQQSQTATPSPSSKRDDLLETKRSRTSMHYRIRELEQLSTPTTTSPSGLTPRVTPTMGEAPSVNSNTSSAACKLISGRPPNRSSYRKSKGKDSLNMSPVLKFVVGSQFGGDADDPAGQLFESLPLPYTSKDSSSAASAVKMKSAPFPPHNLTDTELSELSEDQAQAQCHSPLIESMLSNTQNTFSISEGTSPSHSTSASPQRTNRSGGKDASLFLSHGAQTQQQQQQLQEQASSPVVYRSKGHSVTSHSLSQKRGSKMFSVSQVEDNQNPLERIKKSDSSTSVENVQMPTALRSSLAGFVPAPPQLDEHTMSNKSISPSIHPLFNRLQSQSSRQHSLSPPSSSMTASPATGTDASSGPSSSGTQHIARHSNKGRLYSSGDGRCSSGAMDSIETLRSESEAHASTMSPFSFHHKDLTQGSNSLSLSTLTSTNADDVQDFSARVEKCLSLFSTHAKHQSIIEMYLKRVVASIQSIRDEVMRCAQAIEDSKGFGCAYTSFSNPAREANQLHSVTSRHTSSRREMLSANNSEFQILQSPPCQNLFISGDRSTSPRGAALQDGGMNFLLDPRSRSPALRSPFTAAQSMTTPSSSAFQRSVNFTVPEMGPLEHADASEDTPCPFLLPRAPGVLPSATGTSSARGADRQKQKSGSSKVSLQISTTDGAVASRAHELTFATPTDRRSGSPASTLPDVAKSSTTSWRGSRDARDLVAVLDTQAHGSKGGGGGDANESHNASTHEQSPRSSSVLASMQSGSNPPEACEWDPAAQMQTSAHALSTPLQTSTSPANERSSGVSPNSALPAVHERTVSRHSTASRESRPLVQSFTSSVHEDGHGEPKMQDGCTANSSFNFSDTGVSAPLSTSPPLYVNVDGPDHAPPHQREAAGHTAAVTQVQSPADRHMGSQYSTPLVRSTLRESSDLGFGQQTPKNNERSASHHTNALSKTGEFGKSGFMSTLPPPEQVVYDLPPPLPPQPQITTLADLDMDSMMELGSGAGGRVYAVYRRDTGTTVAVKEIYVSDNSISQVANEISVLWGARQDDEQKAEEDSSSNARMVTLERAGYCISVTELRKSLVSCYGVLQDGATVYIVLEAMTGGSIKDLLRRRKEFQATSETKQVGMTEEECCAVAFQVLHGLLYLHEVRHQLHRDIKPHNVLFDKATGYVKLTDFGISSRPMQSMGFNEHDTYCGTVAYMSPSRMEEDSSYGEESDLWALGISLLEMAHGSLPFNPGVFTIQGFKKNPPRLSGYAEAMGDGKAARGSGKPRKASSSVTYSKEFHDFIVHSLPKERVESDDFIDDARALSDAASHWSPDRAAILNLRTRSSFVDAISTALSPTVNIMSPSPAADVSFRNYSAASFLKNLNSTTAAEGDASFSPELPKVIPPSSEQSSDDGENHADDSEGSCVSSIDGDGDVSATAAASTAALGDEGTPSESDVWGGRRVSRDTNPYAENSGSGRIQPHAPKSPLIRKYPSPSLRRPHTSCGTAVAERRIRTPSPFTSNVALPHPLPQFTSRCFLSSKQPASLSTTDAPQRLAASAGENDHDIPTTTSTQPLGKASVLPSLSPVQPGGSGSSQRMFSMVNAPGAGLLQRPNPRRRESSYSHTAEHSLHDASSIVSGSGNASGGIAYPSTAPPSLPLRLPGAETGSNSFRSSTSTESKVGRLKSDLSHSYNEALVPAASKSWNPTVETSNRCVGTSSASLGKDTFPEDEPLSAALLLSHPWFRNMTMNRSRWIVAQMDPSEYPDDDEEDDSASGEAE